MNNINDGLTDFKTLQAVLQVYTYGDNDVTASYHIYAAVFPPLYGASS